MHFRANLCDERVRGFDLIALRKTFPMPSAVLCTMRLRVFHMNSTVVGFDRLARIHDCYMRAIAFDRKISEMFKHPSNVVNRNSY